MNAPSDISMKNDDVLRVELEVFRCEHAIWTRRSVRWRKRARQIS